MKIIIRLASTIILLCSCNSNAWAIEYANDQEKIADKLNVEENNNKKYIASIQTEKY